MKILFDYSIFCLQQYGGISRYFYELANHLAVFEGHKVEMFVPFYINEYLAVPKSAVYGSTKIPLLSGIGKVTAWCFDTVLAYPALKLRCDVDIFHETYYSSFDFCPRSAKRVITIHDMIYEKFSDQFPNKDRMRQIRKRAIMKADHVICVSENTRRDLLDLLCVPEDKTSVVYHGYSLTKNTKSKPVSLEKPYLLYVGQRSGYKNFDVLLRAYAHSPRLIKMFSLICFGGGSFQPIEQERITTLGLSLKDVMQVSGNDADLSGMYSKAAAFVYPSLYEGFGIPLLEAMALSCPVICSRASSFPEVVGNAAELFDPRDEESLREAIEKVVFSAEHQDSLVCRGRDRSKLFSWDRCAKETMQVYTH